MSVSINTAPIPRWLLQREIDDASAPAEGKFGMTEKILRVAWTLVFQYVYNVRGSMAWESEEIPSASILIILCLQGERNLSCMLAIEGQNI